VLKEEVENLPDLDRYSELLVRLLCAVPGWSEKNVQVCFHNMRKTCVPYFLSSFIIRHLFGNIFI
jgi:hypothetical protein